MGNFVSNTGRKSTNTRDIVFFTKGKARALRPNVKKNRAEPGTDHFMSGTNKMLPTCFDYPKVPKAQQIHESELPVELVMDIISLTTMQGETLVDQFAGSGVTGEAALRMKRNSLLYEVEKLFINAIAKRLGMEKLQPCLGGNK